MNAETIAEGLPTGLIVLLTFLQPHITALFTRPSMTKGRKQCIAIAVAAVIAVVYVLLNGGVDSWEKFFYAAPTIYGLGNIIYGLLVKDTVKQIEATKGFIDKEVVDPAAVEEATDAAVEAGAEVQPAVVEGAEGEKPADVIVVEESPAKG